MTKIILFLLIFAFARLNAEADDAQSSFESSLPPDIADFFRNSKNSDSSPNHGSGNDATLRTPDTSPLSVDALANAKSPSVTDSGQVEASEFSGTKSGATSPSVPSAAATIAGELSGKSASKPNASQPNTSADSKVQTAAEVRGADVQMPADMQQLVVRIRKCTEVWEKEPQPNRRPQPGEAERLEKFQKSLRQSKCSSLSRALITMRQKYKDKPEIVKICDSFISQPPEKYGEILREPAAAK